MTFREGDSAAALHQGTQQRPGSTSARFAFSMESLPLLRSTNLLQQQSPTAAAAPAAAAASAAAAAAVGDEEETGCRELEFDVSEAPSLRCHTADTLYVLPRNKREDVSLLSLFQGKAIRTLPFSGVYVHPMLLMLLLLQVLWWFEALGFEKRGLGLGDIIHFTEETVPFPTPCTVEVTRCSACCCCCCLWPFSCWVAAAVDPHAAAAAAAAAGRTCFILQLRPAEQGGARCLRLHGNGQRTETAVAVSHDRFTGEGLGFRV